MRNKMNVWVCKRLWLFAITYVASGLFDFPSVRKTTLEMSVNIALYDVCFRNCCHVRNGFEIHPIGLFLYYVIIEVYESCGPYSFQFSILLSHTVYIADAYIYIFSIVAAAVFQTSLIFSIDLSFLPMHLILFGQCGSFGLKDTQSNERGR